MKRRSNGVFRADVFSTLFSKCSRNKRGVAGDSITIILSLVVLFTFMILAYYFLTPATVQKAAFSGDHVDVEAEIMLAGILKTETPSGTGLDSLLSFANNVQGGLMSDTKASSIFLKELLPKNPLRYYDGDWILMVWDGDVTQASIYAEGQGPRRWTVENPLKEGMILVRSIKRTDGSYERILKPAREYWYELYQQSRPLVVSTDDGKQEYTLQLYLLRGESVDRIVPESYTPRIGIPTSTGKRVVESIFYSPVTPDELTTCTYMSNCPSYLTENACKNDPCYVSRKWCSWSAGRCVEG